jgi:hypothetical protein
MTLKGRRTNVLGCGCSILVFANDRGWNFNISATESPDPEDNPPAVVWGPGYPVSTPETEVMLAAFKRHKEVCGG